NSFARRLGRKIRCPPTLMPLSKATSAIGPDYRIDGMPVGYAISAGAVCHSGDLLTGNGRSAQLIDPVRPSHGHNHKHKPANSSWDNRSRGRQAFEAEEPDPGQQGSSDPEHVRAESLPGAGCAQVDHNSPQPHQAFDDEHAETRIVETQAVILMNAG